MIPVVRRYFIEGEPGEWHPIDGKEYHGLLWSFDGKRPWAAFRILAVDSPPETAVRGESVYWLEGEANAPQAGA